MAKFPTDVEQSVVVRAPLAPVYAHFWDVVTSARHIPGLASCKRVAKDTYRFTYEEKVRGPVKLIVCYTVRYAGNGVDHISYETIGAEGDNTEVKGGFRLRARGGDATHVSLRQMLAPEVPIPRLLQGLVRPFVEREAEDGMRQYLGKVKRVLENGTR